MSEASRIVSIINALMSDPEMPALSPGDQVGYACRFGPGGVNEDIFLIRPDEEFFHFQPAGATGEDEDAFDHAEAFLGGRNPAVLGLRYSIDSGQAGGVTLFDDDTAPWLVADTDALLGLLVAVEVPEGHTH